MIRQTLGEHPKISVVLPVYNGERYLRQSIESVLNQSYKNFELIVVNDKSTDSTPSIIDEMAKKDARIVFVDNKKNLRLPRSLNKGFSFATGDLFTWTSDDNIFLENAFDEMVSFFVAHPKYDFVFSKIEYIDENGVTNGDANYINGDLTELPLSNCIGACFMYRNYVHKKLHGYNTKKFLVEDYDFWLRVYRDFEMGFIPKVLYYYRNHGESLTATKSEAIQAGRIGLYEDELKWKVISKDIKIMLCKEVADYAYKHGDYTKFRKYMRLLNKYSETIYEEYKGYFDSELLQQKDYLSFIKR
ncbi:glycosyltransferase family 2 protein [Butyrivibrio sp. AD3002]|uniref:glycosyltransferase family 2 protein n=1 Tax=Butyrivibrio sp. AD3002 TaxID=1280670 RepID=UPI0003B323BE|nr:glycosyltransferase [Butyrivibrio sp. AD3002]